MRPKTCAGRQSLKVADCQTSPHPDVGHLVGLSDTLLDCQTPCPDVRHPVGLSDNLLTCQTPCLSDSLKSSTTWKCTQCTVTPATGKQSLLYCQTLDLIGQKPVKLQNWKTSLLAV